MSNALLLFCKEAYNQSNEAIAAALGITLEQYAEIEKGESLITYEQAETLGKLYNNTHGSHIYTSALQLDTLLTLREIVKVLKWENELLKEKVRGRNKTVPGKKAKNRKTNPSR